MERDKPKADLVVAGSSNETVAISRRTVLRTAAAGAGALVAGAGQVRLATPAIAQTTKLAISVARLPFGATASMLPVLMRDKQLVEKAAAEQGYDLTVSWSDFPSGGPIAQGIVAQKIDIGPIGVTPLLNLLLSDQEVTAISVAEGRLKFLIAVRKDSPIHTMDDLKGKTIAMIVGTDYQFSLASMLQAGLGTASFSELGIKPVNVGTPAQLAAVPQGADAAIAHAHPFVKAQLELGSRAIANSYGYTEDYYEGPLGKGAGHLLPHAKSSPFWPESIYGHRAFWVVRNPILKEHPKVVTAFLVAQQRALDDLRKKSPQSAAALSQADWGVPADKATALVEDDLLWRRGWVFPTRGDVEMMWRQTRLVIDQGVIKPRAPFTWDKLRQTFTGGADIVKAAWTATGSNPDEKVFTATDADLRGLPVWEAQRWTAP
jgi:ABC-type nitrate/sulfonate/bicarbonate transport system substrate-binding protein